ncbi:hypothetical protein BKA82DRAFT_4146984 [Pisolithus tinctorius]|nr:hypothetical protein BKA82DRAFT_4146984 [Pisolithus tinctorius]
MSVASLLRGPLIGTCLASLLYGITCLQAFFYFQTYVNDRRGLKLTVALLLTLETIHVALSIWLVDNYLVVNYANERALQSATWLTTVTFCIGFLIDLVVYFYFTWRIWMFTSKLWIVIFMIFMALARTTLSIIACILSVLSSTWVSYLEQYRTLIITSNILFIIGDAFSASIMAWYLNRTRDHALRTTLILNRLLVFAVATGGITVLVDIIALVLTLAQPLSLAFTAAILVQTRLYANSLLVSLNLRNANKRVYENAINTPSVELPMTSLAFAPYSTETGRSSEVASGVGKESWHTASGSGNIS